MAADPFAHGTPVGDSHMWVSPAKVDCPNCSCCTTGLCRESAERGVVCSEHPGLNRGEGFMSVVGCPCTTPASP